jgi:hypothetical protein
MNRECWYGGNAGDQPNLPARRCFWTSGVLNGGRRKRERQHVVLNRERFQMPHCPTQLRARAGKISLAQALPFSLVSDKKDDATKNLEPDAETQETEKGLKIGVPKREAFFAGLEKSSKPEK